MTDDLKLKFRLTAEFQWLHRRNGWEYIEGRTEKWKANAGELRGLEGRNLPRRT